VTNVQSYTTNLASGISVNNSTFTFPTAGVYMVVANFNAWGTDEYLGFRLHRTTGVPQTLLQRTTFTSAGGPGGNDPPGYLSGLFQVNADDALDLQYVVSGGTSSYWTAINPLDGESMVTGEIDIWQIQ
jgi:hypothetical protein